MEKANLYDGKFAVIYCRVSTHKQVESGESLDHQETICKNWCEKHNVKIVKNKNQWSFRDEGISGGKAEIDDLDTKKQNFINSLHPICKKINGIHHRPGLLQALKTCKKDYIFVTYAMTRLSRNATQSLVISDYLKEKKIHLVCIQDNIDTVDKKEDQSVKIHLQSLFSQMEHSAIKERTKSALQALKDQGRYLGRIRYGYKLETGQRYDDLVENEEEQAVIKLMRELREQVVDIYGKKASYFKIAKFLNNQGYKTRSGKQWRHSQIQYILEAPPPNLKGNPKKRAKNGNAKPEDIQEDEDIDSPTIHQEVQKLVKAELGIPENTPEVAPLHAPILPVPVLPAPVLPAPVLPASVKEEPTKVPKKKKKKKEDWESEDSSSDSDEEFKMFLKYKKMMKKSKKSKKVESSDED
jgi:DNA invertase Pin-like site-specific DNA recombinase